MVMQDVRLRGCLFHYTQAVWRRVQEIGLTLVGYMRTQWIYKRTCPPSSLSCFRQTTRTNNHIEGWHRRLNAKVGEQQLGLYRLIKALHREACPCSLSRSSC
ncbi:uncharacterized protein LOC124272678 [Haliotis rubra]|uniref:uncharacterized protein LOC124272678 n=1 Tax=Haliotis rubra TaxID=36100 RepID=UPI001EE56306|nr:uncharacterized protein LOC124272678 [Haliotis rubra]